MNQYLDKISIKEYKKSIIQQQNTFFAVFYILGLASIRVNDREINNDNSDYFYEIRELSPFNPLSYIIAIVFCFIGLLSFGLKKQLFRALFSLFKYSPQI